MAKTPGVTTSTAVRAIRTGRSKPGTASTQQRRLGSGRTPRRARGRTSRAY